MLSEIEKRFCFLDKKFENTVLGYAVWGKQFAPILNPACGSVPADGV